MCLGVYKLYTFHGNDSTPILITREGCARFS